MMSSSSESHPQPLPPAWLAWIFAATIFVSAFLLFQVQPLISKIILPWFGGSPAVWTTCLLFFQMLLVAGYGYAFVLTSQAPRVWQGLIHFLPLGVALGTIVFFPPSEDWKPQDASQPPALQILLLLAACIGAPYFVLSTTGPLLQGWYSRVFPDQSAYRLYALSNIGSLGALLSYPFVFEPLLKVSTQGLLWSISFAAFAALCGTVGFMLWQLRGGGPATAESEVGGIIVPPGPEPKPAIEAEVEDPSELSGDTFMIWLLLPAVATVMLMSVTTHICQDITPIPLLWVVPLSLYLLSFILCFERGWINPLLASLAAAGFGIYLLVSLGGDQLSFLSVFKSLLGLLCLCAAFLALYFRYDGDWYCRPFFAAGAILSTLAVGALMVSRQIDTGFGNWLDARFGMLRQVDILGWQWKVEFFSLETLREEIMVEAGCYFAMVFFVCMVCHGELARRKPAAGHLTLYYFLIAVGGAMGGLYVALICPMLYDNYLELYQVIIAGLLIGAAVLILDGSETWLKEIPLRIAVGLLALSLLGFLGMSVYTVMQAKYVYRARTFYGVLTVVDEELVDDTIYGRSLRNGRIMHGFQHARPVYTLGDLIKEPLATGGESLQSLVGDSLTPTTYYSFNSGFGKCMFHYSERKGGGMRMGMVGLGTGTAACYTSRGDYCAFYEINDEVRRIAYEYFTFVPSALGRVEVKIGDARLTLEQEAKRGDLQHFDVIALDAFSGDAIPAHLLTRESFALYLQHLNDDGTIAVHVSNRYLDLIPVVAAISKEHQLEYIQIEASDTGKTSATSASTWILVTRKLDNLPPDLVAQDAKKPDINLVLWTDDWSPLWPILR